MREHAALRWAFEAYEEKRGRTVKAADGSDTIDPGFFNFVAQMAHFWTMFGLVTIFGATLGVCLSWNALWFGVGVILDTAYAAFHEFYWDPRHENPVTRGSDVEDFCFLVAGGLTATGVFMLLKFLAGRYGGG